MEITVGITCYNEGGNIGHLLSDLRGQTLREGFRIRSVLVVASGCTDGTVEVVKKFSELDGRVRLVKEKKRNGKPSAINLILEQAEGEVLVLLGGDIFQRYRDSEGLVLEGSSIGEWEEVSASSATFTDTAGRVSFGLSSHPEARLFRGREMVPGNLSWSGLSLIFPPTITQFKYNVRVEPI